MLISRGVGPLRYFITKLNQPILGQGTQSIRKSHGSIWSYRQPVSKHPKHIIILAEVVGGYMWWWIFWHFWHESGHVFGEVEYPNPSKWTDEELGILPDDEE
ncbi:NADH dehydrogenase [ubiquinone] 1 beta subcomplex subunit 2, mitochondrial-like [Zootermopsis nevadensis]|uniref:NADH dehydrogenase [ubiquinone] 1 beta subcomplex subunit 2, mitochondrial n=1 Tax=Zootermopsis nevadensis TaxID=136037 RepID=A0A067QZ68_ZOONE|nr:NADH dehydrogenase [ubiquinone] 1 beta subcomplex subunit 2, mitochondrial-like [Zootermopsis nevadensis]KDR10338.1 NADH dehydrogenase [ubiquinone] 1 beta subcomplex subunit 2, mitochondrial [Zootermopsis nevadensis]